MTRVSKRPTAFPVLAALIATTVAAPMSPARAEGVASGSEAALVLAEAAASDKVALLHELAVIESDVRLGLLFAWDHLADPTGSHASDPHLETWPKIGPAMLAAGVTDLGPLSQALAEAADEDAVIARAAEVLKAVTLARGQLAASDAEVGQSVLELAREAAGLLNPDGPTPLADYQDAWSLLTVARTEADLLLRADDPALANSAVKIALALDDVLLFLPDPAATGPVTCDKAALDAAISVIDGLLDETA